MWVGPVVLAFVALGGFAALPLLESLLLPGPLAPPQYFNVDTEDVVSRLKAACVPFKSRPFLEVAGRNPDLYGPFWLAATLVFVIGVTSNMAGWMGVPQEQVSV